MRVGSRDGARDRDKYPPVMPTAAAPHAQPYTSPRCTSRDPHQPKRKPAAKASPQPVVSLTALSCARDAPEIEPRDARDTPEIHPRYTRDTPELKGRPSPRWPRAWFGWNHHCCSVAATAPSGPSVTTTSGAPRACKRRTASEISYLHSLPLLSHTLPHSPPPRSRTYTHNSPPPPPPRPFPTGAPPAPLAHHVARRPAMATPAMEAASRWLQSSTSVCGSSSRSPPSQAPAVSEMSRSEPRRAEVSRDQSSSRGPPFLPPRISHNLPRISHNLPTRLSRPSEAQSRRSHRAPPWLAPSAEAPAGKGPRGERPAPQPPLTRRRPRHRRLQPGAVVVSREVEVAGAWGEMGRDGERRSGPRSGGGG